MLDRPTTKGLPGIDPGCDNYASCRRTHIVSLSFQPVQPPWLYGQCFSIMQGSQASWRPSFIISRTQYAHSHPVRQIMRICCLQEEYY